MNGIHPDQAVSRHLAVFGEVAVNKFIFLSQTSFVFHYEKTVKMERNVYFEKSSIFFQFIVKQID